MRWHFPAVVNKQLNMNFQQEAGKLYSFKLISRALDTLHKIDFIPHGIDATQELPGKRISEIKFGKENDYFTYTFNYVRPQECKSVDITFDGIDYPQMSANDFVLYIFKTEELILRD